MESLPKVLIIDLGSQYTKVIERTIRELGVRSMILDPKRAEKLLESEVHLDAIILSGSGKSVYQENAPQPPRAIFDRQVPILGICYGMQWLAKHFGGYVERKTGQKEYGQARISLLGNSPLFQSTPPFQTVWASHGDSVTLVPSGFEPIALSMTGHPVAMHWSGRNICGVQFHPEVTHTEHGKQILRNFIFGLACCRQDWQPASMIEEIRTSVLEEIGLRRVVLGFSGGVDSTTLAGILSPVLAERLTCLAIDGGQLRENELDEIQLNAGHAGVRLHINQDSERFVLALGKSTDSEDKRFTFRQMYAGLLIQKAYTVDSDVVIQGTLAPDMIESGVTGGETIKTHHNVGLRLPEGWLGLHPLSHLFKYEVRALAKELGLPESVWNRKPFPGPGLFLRVVGTPVTKELLDLVRWSDARVREITTRRKLNDTFDQLVVARVCKLVGIKGDERVYGEGIMVRAVKTLDHMTADGVRFPEEVKEEFEATLTQHPKVVAVLYNENDKPSCTIEPE